MTALDPLGDENARQEPVPYTTEMQPGDIVWIAADLAGVSFLSKLPGIKIVHNYQVGTRSTDSLVDFTCSFEPASELLVGAEY